MSAWDDFVKEGEDMLDEEKETPEIESWVKAQYIPLVQKEGHVRVFRSSEVKYIGLFDKDKNQITKLKVVNLPDIKIEKGSKLILTWEVDFT